MKKKKQGKKVVKKKITKKKKPVAKKKKRAPAKQKHEVSIRIKVEQSKEKAIVVREEDIIPQKEAGKYMLVPSAFQEKQVMRMLQRTPKQHIYSRKGKGGQNFDYVTGTYMKKVLNYVFGWMWSFDIIDVEEKHGQVIVRGKLTIHKKDGSPMIWKTDIGNADIKYLQKTQKHLDYGNDVKAATTDCIKRCAAQFGFASDVYGKSEFKDIKRPIETEDGEVQVGDQKVEKENFDDYLNCEGACGGVVSPEAAEYSKKVNKGKIYCKECLALKKK